MHVKKNKLVLPGSNKYTVVTMSEEGEENLEAFVLQVPPEGIAETTFDTDGCNFSSKWFSEEEDGVFASKEYKLQADKSSDNICILNENGDIIYTNGAWNRFSEINEGENENTGIGINYLRVCDSACSGPGNDMIKNNAKAFYEGLSRLLSGETREEVSLIYPCDAPVEKRWYLARAFTFNLGSTRRTIVCHCDITKDRDKEEEDENTNEKIGEKRAHDSESEQVNKLAKHNNDDDDSKKL